MSFKPKLSIIVVCYRMQTQIRNTIQSLSASYQNGVSESDYEVILLENSSDQEIDVAEIDALPANFRYLRREEASHSPAAAINEGFRLARGEFIGVMIDGAYMMTPGVVKFALL